MNRNAEIIRNTLKMYKEKRDEADAKVKRIREDYGEEAAQKELARQNNLLKSSRAAAESAIRAAAGEEQKNAVAWGKLDGSKLTDDIKLLDSGLVDVEAFNGLKEKYQDNATMLSALRKYADKQNAAAAREAHEKGDHFAMIEPFETRDIPTVEDKSKTWERAQASAFNMLDAMDRVGKYGNPRDWGAQMVVNALPGQIEHFGEDL